MRDGGHFQIVREQKQGRGSDMRRYRGGQPYRLSLGYPVKIFRECRSGLHHICPESLKVEPDYFDPDKGKVPSGRHVTIYCECPCHAEHKTNTQEKPR